MICPNTCLISPIHHSFYDEEKNVTYPTDAKLHKKIVGKVLKIVKDLNLPLRQSDLLQDSSYFYNQHEACEHNPPDYV